MGFVLVNSRSEDKFSIRRDKHQNRQLPLLIQMVIAISIAAAVSGSTLYFLGFYPHQTHRETLKEAQLREYKNAMEKEINDDLEADMRSWQQKTKELSQKPIKKAN